MCVRAHRLVVLAACSGVGARPPPPPPRREARLGLLLRLASCEELVVAVCNEAVSQSVITTLLAGSSCPTRWPYSHKSGYGGDLWTCNEAAANMELILLDAICRKQGRHVAHCQSASLSACGSLWQCQPVAVSAGREGASHRGAVPPALAAESTRGTNVTARRRCETPFT